jgi:hypothetical protein
MSAVVARLECPSSLENHSQVLAVLQEQRGASVPEVMEPMPWQTRSGDVLLEPMGDVDPVQRRAGRRGENVVAGLPAASSGKALFQLPPSMLAEGTRHGPRHDHRSTTVRRLGFDEPQSAVYALEECRTVSTPRGDVEGGGSV